jgi:hypothetical protein
MDPQQTTSDYLNGIDEEIRRKEEKWILNGLFVPTWDNKPPEKKPTLSINGISILSFQNLTSIIAQPGAGKSSVNECIISSVINKDCDSFGIETEIENVMYIDFERTDYDVWRSFERVMKRAKIQKGVNVDNVKIFGCRDMPKANDRKERVELLLNLYKPKLLLLDGLGDLVDDTNSLEQAIECKMWLRSIESKFEVSVLTTLHPNKNSLTPRGHVGSELLRESESVLAILVDSDGKRTLTTDFQHGKARNSGHATTSFTWCDENMMFVKCDVVPREQKVKLTPTEKLTEEEIIILINNTHQNDLSYEKTKSVITDYLKRFIGYVKTNNNDIIEFIKYLEDNTYLIRAKNETDKRRTFYKMNVNYKE